MEKERRIVVGIEGSGYARAALVWALEEALHRDALVEVVTCYLPTYIPSSPDLGYVPFDGTNLITEVKKLQNEVVESAMKISKNPNVQIKKTIERGRAPETLMSIAEGADMLVVGNRGRGGFAGLRLGSVSQAISHHSPCPLVIVRTGLMDE